MTLEHPGGVVWSIANRRLVVSTESGVPLADIDLADGGIYDVALALMHAGVQLIHFNSEFFALKATTLLDGQGSESEKTNVLHGHRSVLWGMIDGYATEVQAAQDALPQALQQARLISAEGEWLDFWGSYFNAPRGAVQSDATYLATIVAETLRAKSNKYAIENAVFDITGSQVEITEPWQSIFRLDASQLSGEHALHDGVVTGYHLIRPLIPSGADWDGVMAVIEKTRPAGVLVSNPVRVIPALQVVVMPIEPTVCASRIFNHTFLVGKIDTNVLGRLVLDGSRSSINHQVMIFSLVSPGNTDRLVDDLGWAGAWSMGRKWGADGSIGRITPWRSIAKSAITLSDGYALGDINAVLGRGRVDRQIVPTPSLSGALALSDARAVVTVARATEITRDARGASLAVATPTEQRDTAIT